MPDVSHLSGAIPAVEQTFSTTTRQSLPGKLKSSYKDNGSVPSYLASFEDAFGDSPTTTVTKTFRHCLSGAIRTSRTFSATPQPSSTVSQHEPEIDYSTQLRKPTHSSSPSDTSSTLAGVYLEKALNKGRTEARSKDASLIEVKSFKGRWPPDVSKSPILPQSKQKGEGTTSNRAEPSNTEPAQTEKVPRDSLSGIEAEEMIQSSADETDYHMSADLEENTKLKHSSENPCDTSGQEDESSYSSEENDLLSAYYGDSSISSYGLSDLRPSYKVSYFGPGALRGGREWEDGVVDASFPSMPISRRFDSEEESLEARFGDTENDNGLPTAPNRRRFASDEETRMDSMPCLPMKDRFESLDRNSDHSLPGIPSHDRRFDRGSASGAPHKPGRQQSIILPAVWQTRIFETPKVQDSDRKWRLKRVWEMDNKIIDDSEPDYVVSEPHLRQALTVLLRVEISPDEIETETAATALESSSENSDDPQKSDLKLWKLQKVWDRRGEIVVVDDEESIDGEEMLKVFESEKHITQDSLLLEYTDYTTEKQGDEKETSQTLAADNDDSQSIGFDDLQESFSSSHSLGDSFHDPDSLEQKLALVAQEISEVMSDTSNATLTRAKVQKLQEKISRCVEKMEKAELRRYNESIDGLDCSFSESFEEEDTPSPLFDTEDSRDEELIRRKLRKTERMMSRMVDEGGEEVKKKKKYKSLKKKQNQYQVELAETSSGIVSHCSMLHDLGMDVIEEEASTSSRQVLREKNLLQRKLRKVEKSLSRMQLEEGPDVVSTKKYLKLADKRSKYQEELRLASS